MSELSVKQHKQLEWVDVWEYKYINANRGHIVKCKDCNIEKIFVAASSVRDFIIHFHKGHNTTYVAKKGVF